MLRPKDKFSFICRPICGHTFDLFLCPSTTLTSSVIWGKPELPSASFFMSALFPQTLWHICRSVGKHLVLFSSVDPAPPPTFSPLSFLPLLIAVRGAITSYITNTSGMHVLQAWPYNWRLNIFPKAWGGRLVVLLVQPHSSFIFHPTLHPVCHYQLWFAVLHDCESLHLFKTYSVFRTSTVLSRFFCAQEFCFFSFTWSKKSLMKGPHSLLQEWVTKREEVSLTSVKSMTHVERSPGLDLQAQNWFRLSQLAL